MLPQLSRRCAHLGRTLARALRQRQIAATKPADQSVVAGTLTDLVRGRLALILRRSVKRPRCTPADRALLVLLASHVRA